MALITDWRRMKFTEKMSHRWSIVTFKKQMTPMNKLEFELAMEFNGFETYGRQTNKFFKAYIKAYEHIKNNN